MSCIFCCFDDSPIDGDERATFIRQWQTNMAAAPIKEPLCCCTGLLCPACTAYSLRQEVLGGTLQEYSCCQGYFDCAPCFVAGNCGESSSPECCLCLEACCCTHFAVQATRFYMMDTRQIRPDKVDNQIIRCHNCLQCLACVCELAACLSRDADIIDAANTIRLIADCVYVIVLSCFAAQVKYELRAEKAGRVDGPSAGGAPVPMAMDRFPSSHPPRGPHHPQMVMNAQPPTYPHGMQMQQPQQPMAPGGGGYGGYPVQQPMAAPMPQSMGQMFLVQVPPNVAGGQPLMVQAPNGQMMQVVVPHGVRTLTLPRRSLDPACRD